jgi:hypothetical protein
MSDERGKPNVKITLARPAHLRAAEKHIHTAAWLQSNLDFPPVYQHLSYPGMGIGRFASVGHQF